MSKIFFALFLVLLGFAHTTNALADHRGYVYRRSPSIMIGPVWGPWYFPPPWYHQPPVIIEREPPPVYIEKPRAEAPSGPTNFWYFCRAANAYYPDVRECPAGWIKVAPRPPD